MDPFEQDTMVVAHVSTESCDHYMIAHLFKAGEVLDEEILKREAGEEDLGYLYVEDYVYITKDDFNG